MIQLNTLLVKGVAARLRCADDDPRKAARGSCPRRAVGVEAQSLEANVAPRLPGPDVVAALIRGDEALEVGHGNAGGRAGAADSMLEALERRQDHADAVEGRDVLCLTHMGFVLISSVALRPRAGGAAGREILKNEECKQYVF